MRTATLSLVLVVALHAYSFQAVAAPFAIYGISMSDSIDAPNVGSLQTRHVPGPFVWQDSGVPTLVGWDGRATYQYDYVLGDATPEADNVFSFPLNSYSLITAHNEMGDPIGELEFTGIGPYYINLDAADAIVDEVGGLILTRTGGPGGLPGPIGINTITKSTGVFASQAAVDDLIELQISGYGIRDLIPGMPLQDNIFAAPLHGFVSEFAFVSVPEPTGIALALFGAAGLCLAVLLQRRENTSDRLA